jgi:hypothetical protein
MGLLSNLMSKIFSHSSTTVAATGGISAAPAAAATPAGAQPAAAPPTAAPAAPVKIVDVAVILDGLGCEESGKARLEEIDCGSHETRRNGQQFQSAEAVGAGTQLHRRSKRFSIHECLAA